ncbi:hypothetical protein HPB50_015675 [Hyalomma asiaticum]|uniref:Uncharacterized protein n=1 Tax=Hyalomma asiaticum TaxID=266040 RepID=A0ACB7S7Y3_HYAAI|nr:hypothetical protein HPB50_015675 [Hyalomma asiaticum]
MVRHQQMHQLSDFFRDNGSDHLRSGSYCVDFAQYVESHTILRAFLDCRRSAGKNAPAENADARDPRAVASVDSTGSPA